MVIAGITVIPRAKVTELPDLDLTDISKLYGATFRKQKWLCAEVVWLEIITHETGQSVMSSQE